MKPQTVRWAIRLLVASIVISVVRTALRFDRIAAAAEESKFGPWFVFAVTAGVLVVIGLFIFAISRRQSWARWIYVVLLAIGLPFSAPALAKAFSEMPIDGVLGVIDLVIQVAAVVLLFVKPSRDWFAKPPAPSSQRFPASS